jgi:hypothetical protein
MVGGILGYQTNSPGVCSTTISNSFTSGAVTIDTSGFGDANGILGWNSGGPDVGLTNDYSRATLSGGTTQNGLASSTGFTVTNSYWLKDIGVNASATSDGREKTVTELQTASTFAGWDFTTIWNAPSAGTYPSLR